MLASLDVGFGWSGERNGNRETGRASPQWSRSAMTGDLRSGIPNLASNRRLDHCGVGEVFAGSRCIGRPDKEDMSA